MDCRGKRGQNVIEYILLIVAVLVVFIVFLSPQGVYKRALENTLMNGAVKQIKGFSDQIKF